MIQLRQLVDFILIEITPLEEPLGCHKKLLIGWLLGVGNDTINYNMKIIMSGFSRKLVLLLVTIIWQSSLGTNAALKDFSNVSTKSLSQNGYYKLPDGLLIQWGTGGNGVNQIVYFPTSFYNTSYVVVTTAISSVMNSIVKMINGKNISYFKVYSVGPTIEAGEIFGWIAIGRWK
ncbi:hypothetical protein AAH091_01615 [Candidatus Bacteroides intestinigallinarum]|jgi:hypothetical protein|uniref:gp53-like domain-containing protein n=1 Tax=Candidatus Bacteroides intestinigallinarum TaxID=2838470 RepID=UPI0039B4F563